MKILIIQTAFIGDVILATALIEKISTSIPDAEIHFLVRKGNQGLLENHPLISRLWVFDKSDGKYRNLLKLIRQFRREHFDYVVNAQRFFTTGLITVLSAGKYTIGFNKNPLSFLFSKKVKHIIGDGNHEVSRNQLLIEELTDTISSKPKLYPSEENYQAIEKYQNGKYVCIAPTSVWFTKQFLEEKWIEFLNQLPQDINVYLLGAPDDYDACERMIHASTIKAVVNLSGKLSLLDSAALMGGSAMNYVNDSAPMHLATAMNAPVCAVYCSTVPDFGFGPLSDVSHVVDTKKDLDCRPCGLHGHRSCPKGHFKCASTIEIHQLLELL